MISDSLRQTRKASRAGALAPPIPVARMGDVQRNMCQLLLAHGIFSERQLLDLFEQCIVQHKADAKRARLTHTGDDDKDRRTLMAVIDALNGQLESLGMKIAKLRSRASGSEDWYYGVVNLGGDDPFSRLADSLNKAEQEYFHKLITRILESEDMEGDRLCLESELAISVRQDLSSAKMTQNEAVACLERLERGNWLAKSDEGNYSLGVRTELQRRYLTAKPEAEAE